MSKFLKPDDFEKNIALFKVQKFYYKSDRMKTVFVVKPENKSKVENIVRRDELISRQSITIRSAESLNLDEKYDGYFLIIDGDEKAVEKANELLKDLCKKIEKDEKEILDKIKEDEDKAIEGFGNIVG